MGEMVVSVASEEKGNKNGRNVLDVRDDCRPLWNDVPFVDVVFDETVRNT